jgi:hypothetical protein
MWSRQAIHFKLIVVSSPKQPPFVWSDDSPAQRSVHAGAQKANISLLRNSQITQQF